MPKMNLAINGFGRIGRAALKIIFDRFPDINIVAINDLSGADVLAPLLSRDSCYGRYHLPVVARKNVLKVGGHEVRVLSEKDPALLPWRELKVDVVLECTGRFRSQEELSLHLQAGAKKVLLSAPAKKGSVKTVVLGVNEKKINKSDKLLSCASCTTNCLAPVSAVIKDNFGIKKSLMSTVHSYTADQNLVDGPHKDPRRARAAALNIVPTTTGAALATTEVIPSLKDGFDGLALRVPTPVGSLCDIVYVLNKKTDIMAVNRAFKKAAKGKLKGIIEASSEPLVSSDIVGNPHSAIIDLESTKIIGGDLLKVIAWYDNEWGYANRLVELARYWQRK